MWVMTARVAESSAAAPIPWTARAMINQSAVGAIPQPREARPKMISPAMTRCLCPKVSPRVPPASRSAAKVTVYAVTIHCSSGEVGAEPGSDRGQRYVDDGDIQKDQEHSRAHHRQHRPPATGDRSTVTKIRRGSPSRLHPVPQNCLELISWSYPHPAIVPPLRKRRA